jgi:DNA transposition AAA+ family ATPase
MNKQQIVSQLNEKLKKTGLSQNKAAVMLDISGATLSNLLNGKWANISSAVWEVVAKFVGYAQEWVLAPTANFEKVQKVCADAQNNSRSVAISHDAGMGKTASLKHYANNNANVIYVQCEEYFTKKGFLIKILQGLGVHDLHGGIEELAERTVEHLLKLSRPLIILDEADKLKDHVIQLYKTLYNKTEGACGFVLCGTPNLRISIEKKAKKDKQGYKEILSRIGSVFIGLKDITAKDIRTICAANGIQEEVIIKEITTNGLGKDLRYIRRLIENAKLMKGGTI